jgi:hypothetical protein
MPNRSLVTQLDPKVSAHVLRDALADFDALTLRAEDTEEADFLTGDEHPELAPDASGW